MSEKRNKLTGVQQFMLAGLIGIARGAITGYCCLSDKEKKELHKKTAERMLNNACRCRLAEPYDEDEIKYIKEGLRL